MSIETLKLALDKVQEFKSRWWKVPPFGNKVNKATREAITLAQVPILELEDALRQAIEQTELVQRAEEAFERSEQYNATSDHVLMENAQGDLERVKLVQTGVGIGQPEQAQPVDDDKVMTVVYRNVSKDDAKSFTDHPKAVWFGWCHAPYQRDEARYKLEKVASPPSQPEQKPCLMGGQCKHGLWCSEVYCQEHCEFVEQAEQAKPVDWEAVAADQAMTIAMMKAEQAQPVALIDAIKLEPTELIHKWRVLELIQTAPPQGIYYTAPARQPITDEQIDAAIKAWFENEIVAGRQPFAKRMRAAFAAAHGNKEQT